MNFLNYLWKSNSTRRQIILTGLFVIAFLIAVFYSLSQSMGWGDMWQKWMDPSLAFATVIIAIFIWYNEKKQDWENNLPKRLDVFFYHKDKEDKAFYEVKNAPLAGDNDIRQWGQQIGKQMNDDKNLSFNGFKVEESKRDIDTNGKYVMRYTLTVWLQKIDKDKVEKVWLYDDDGKLIEPKSAENS